MTQTTAGGRARTGRDYATGAVTVAGPLLLLSYGVLRWIDGRDGSHGPGQAWDLGHTAFLLAILAFAALGVLLRPRSALGTVAAAAVVLGAAAFVWVILGDLSAGIDEAVKVPDPLFTLGPLLLQLG